MRRKVSTLLLILLLGLSGSTIPDVNAHPSDPPHTFVWEGHWTATWDANGVWRITERADFVVSVAFGGPEATQYSSGTATLRVIEFQDLGPSAPCRIQLAPLPSSPMTIPIGVAVRWARPSSPVPSPGVGEMDVFIGEFMPIIVRGELSCPGGAGSPVAIFSLGTHGALCRTAAAPTAPGCRGFGYFTRPYAVHGLLVRDELLVQTREPGASGDIFNTFHLEIEAAGRCPAPGREAWVLQRMGPDLNSATVNGRPAFDLGASVPVQGAVLATDANGILAVQFTDLSEVWLHPSSQVRISGASCSPSGGMQIYLLVERGSIEIVYGGHLGGGIGYIISPTASPRPTVIMTYHPDRVRSF